MPEQQLPEWLSSILLELPINSEFCWMHLDRAYGGGWQCQHPDCVDEEHLLRSMKNLLVVLSGQGYKLSEIDETMYLRSPETGMLHQIKTCYDIYDLCGFAKTTWTTPEMKPNESTDVINDILARVEMECAAIWEEVPVTEKRRTVDVG